LGGDFPLSFSASKRKVTWKPSSLLNILLVLALLTTTAVHAYPAPDASVQTQVRTILIRFPAASAAERDVLAAELLKLGPGAIREVCGGLARPGAADDSLARFALDAVSIYAAKPGIENQRKAYAQELLAALRKAPVPEVKMFLIGELQIAGKEESVRSLGRYLKVGSFAGPAARALVAIGGAEAERVLIESLEISRPECAAHIIQALGGLRSRAAVRKLMPLAGGKEEKLRGAALEALANIGDPASRLLLGQTAVTSSVFERGKAASLYLLYARRLWESGRNQESEEICREFIKNATLSEESQVRASALTLLSEILGPGVLDILLEAAESPDAKFRQRALELASLVPGEAATALWIEKLGKLMPESQADVIAMLGRRGDRSSLPAIQEMLKSEDQRIRLAALEASLKLGGADISDDLWPLIQSDDESQISAVKAALLTLPASRVIARAAASMDDVPPTAQAALIDILAERRAYSYADAVLAKAQSEHEIVRRAALTALEVLSRREDVPQLIELLIAATDSRDILLIQNGLAAAANRIAEPEKRADVILAALEKTRGPKRADLIRPLAKIGGVKALECVLAQTRSENPQVWAIAVYTLSNWPDVSAIEPLFAVAGGAPDRRTRSLALQGIVRLIGQSGITPAEKLAGLVEALGLAVETDEKAAVIGGLSQIKTVESLNTAAEFLDDPALRARAAQAVVPIALPSPGIEGLSGVDVALILCKAAPYVESVYDRDDLERYFGKALLKEGFSPLFNGKDLSGWKGLVADPVRRAKMSPKELARAQEEADELARRHWRVVDGSLVFDGGGHSLCTSRDYEDFELFVDWKIGPKGDSGIYLRGSPQVQIWDTAQYPEGSGGLYNNKLGPSKPLVCADRPVGEWNTFYIKMAGERVTVYLNGVLVVDNVVLENYWERDKPIYPAGQIELQAHSTPLYFKNIYIREIRR
jgi:HEAT repeat protein